MWIEEFAMPGWDEASVDELLVDPIVRDLMTADGVDPPQLRAMLYGVQRTIECYATGQGGPSSLAGFVKLCSAKPKAGVAPPNPRVNRGQSNLRDSRTAHADHSRLSPAPSLLDRTGQRTARS
jgi:hypothetical protein